MSNKVRGGKREGAGRPKLPASERLHPVTVWLTEDQIAFCKAQGHLSDYVRALIEREKSSE